MYSVTITKTATGVLEGSTVDLDFIGFGSSARIGPDVNITIQLGSTVLYNDNMSNYVATYGNHGSANFSGTATTDNPVSLIKQVIRLI